MRTAETRVPKLRLSGLWPCCYLRRNDIVGLGPVLICCIYVLALNQFDLMNTKSTSYLSKFIFVRSMNKFRGFLGLFLVWKKTCLPIGRSSPLQGLH